MSELTDVLVGIGELKQEARSTNDHLAKLNGSITTLFNKSEINASNLLKHQIECPGLDMIQQIKHQLDTGEFHGSLEVRARLLKTEADELIERAKNKVTSKWIDKLLLPIAKWLIAGIVILALLHANDLLKLVGK